MRGRRPLPTTGRAKARVVAKTCGRAQTRPEHNLGEDARHREDTCRREVISRRQVRRRHIPVVKTRVVAKKTSRGQVWRRQASSRRHVGGLRHFPKTGQAKTRRREDTWAGEDTSRRKREETRPPRDTWAGEDTSRRQVWLRHASSRRHALSLSRRHVGGRRDFPKTGRVLEYANFHRRVGARPQSQTRPRFARAL